VAIPRSTISEDKLSLGDRSEDCIILELFIPRSVVSRN
jgi:hypothetical protein